MSDLAMSARKVAEAKAANKGKQPFYGIANNESIKVSKPVKNKAKAYK
ncbi:MAG: hypothetical protein ACKOQ8_02250 [Micrococcales bacterium]